MYTPKLNLETRPEVLHQVMRDNPFVTLVTPSANGPEVNHIPVVLDADAGAHGRLRGHVARANPMWQTLLAEGESVVIFHAAHHYVSPSWYPSKHSDPRVVPTWNYVAVHAWGTLRVIHDAAWLRSLVAELTDRHEAGRPDRWHVTDAPQDFLEKMTGAIVGLELDITRLNGKVKASQNRSAEDRAGVVAGLMLEGTDAAKAMSAWVPKET